LRWRVLRTAPLHGLFAAPVYNAIDTIFPE